MKRRAFKRKKFGSFKGRKMKNLAVLGLAIVAFVTGCTSKSSEEKEVNP
jgi:hypothetical protein